MKVYVASSLSHADAVKALYLELEKDGWTITHKWPEHGSVQDQGPEAIRKAALDETAGVMSADLLIVLLPGGRGTHAELGIACGIGKPIIIAGETMQDGYESSFYYMPNVLQRIAKISDWEPWNFILICREALRWWLYAQKPKEAVVRLRAETVE